MEPGRRIRGSHALVLGLIVLGVLPSAAAAAARKRTCRLPRGATTVEISRHAVVYRRPISDGYEIVGCWRPTGRRTGFFVESTDTLFGATSRSALLLAGRFIAYTAYTTDRYGASNSSANRVDLRSGRGTVLAMVSTGPCFCPAQPIPASLGPLVLAANGTSGWRQEDKNGQGVWSNDRRGTTLLDQGAEPVSHLRLVRGILSWTRAGHFLHARLVR
jgi:hypothetical protein